MSTSEELVKHDANGFSYKKEFAEVHCKFALECNSKMGLGGQEI